MSLTKVSYSMLSGAFVNVLDYGADPAGSDSTVAIQLAIDACKTAGVGNGSTLYFPKGVYKIKGVHIPDHITLQGEGLDEFKPSPIYGTVIEAIAGGTEVNAVTGDTVLINGNSAGYLDQITIKDIYIKNTVYDWAIAFDGFSPYFTIESCTITGGDTSASSANKGGIYFYKGGWQYINNTQLIYCGIGVQFANGDWNNNTTVNNCKLSFCDIGVKFDSGVGASINSCSFEANLTWDVISLRENVVMTANYFDGSAMKLSGVKTVTPQQFNPSYSTDYDAQLGVGRQTMGSYFFGIPHLDRTPVWKLGTDITSYLSLNCLEIGSKTSIGTRDNQKVDIATNTYSLLGNGQVQYMTPAAGSSAIVAPYPAAGWGMTMSQSWTIGLSFYSDNVTPPTGTVITLMSLYDSGKGINFYLYGATGASPGFILCEWFKGGVDTAATSATRVLQGLNIFYVAYSEPADTFILSLNGNITAVSGASAKMEIASSGTSTIFANLFTEKLYFNDFSAVKGNGQGSFSMHGTKYKDIEVTKAAADTMTLHTGINFPIPNVEQLTGTKVLTLADVTHQILDANGSTRDITLPNDATSVGRVFYFVNASSGAHSLVVKASGGGTILTIAQNKWGWVVNNGTTWYGGAT